MSTPPAPSNAPAWNVGFALLTALYVLSFPYHPGLRSPNELCRLWQARALIDHHALSINQTIREYGYVGDLSCVAVAMVNGQRTLARCVGEAPPGPVIEQWYYPSKAPLLSFLAAPVYGALKAISGSVSEVAQVYASRLLITVLPALLLVFWLRRFLREWVSGDLADLVAFTYGLGTMAYCYAEAFLSHQVTAVLVGACFISAWKAAAGGPRWRWVLAGLAAGAAVACEYTGALGIGAIATWVVVHHWGRWRALGEAAGLVTLGAAPLIAGLMAYHWACFGGPLTSGYVYLNDAAYQAWHLGGFLGIRYPDARAFGLSLFSPLRGLFTLSPFLLLTFAGLTPLRQRHRALFVMVVLTLVTNAYFTSSFTYDSWGWTVGPRHLTPMLPLLLVPIALGLERLHSQGTLPFSIGAGLCVTSVLATGLVCFVNYVPDNVSTSLWGLAVPLLRDGYWPVSILAVFVANPTSGALLVLVFAGAVAWLVRHARGLKGAGVVLALVTVAHFGALRVFTRADGNDTGALNLLKQVWLAPNGTTLLLKP